MRGICQPCAFRRHRYIVEIGSRDPPQCLLPPGQTDKAGYAAPTWACQQGHDQCVLQLIDAGASVDQHEKDGNSCLPKWLRPVRSPSDRGGPDLKQEDEQRYHCACLGPPKLFLSVRTPTDRWGPRTAPSDVSQFQSPRLVPIDRCVPKRLRSLRAPTDRGGSQGQPD